MRFRPRSIYDVMAAFACFVALGGTAMAVDGSLPGQNTVGSADIIDGEVTPADIRAESIGGGKIADRQVKNADLGLGASSSNTIADGGIEGIDVKNGTLTGDDLGFGAVDRPEIQFDAVGGEEIEDGAVQAADLATDVIPADGDLGDGDGSTKLATDSVGGTEIADDSVDGNRVLDGSLSGDDLVDGSLTADDLASSVITPVAVGAFAGDCVSSTNCPLEFNQGVTGVRRVNEGHYCIEAGGAGSFITAEPWTNGTGFWIYPVLVSGAAAGGPDWSCETGEFAVVTHLYRPDGEPDLGNHIGFSFTIY